LPGSGVTNQSGQLEAIVVEGITVGEGDIGVSIGRVGARVEVGSEVGVAIGTLVEVGNGVSVAFIGVMVGSVGVAVLVGANVAVGITALVGDTDILVNACVGNMINATGVLSVASAPISTCDVEMVVSSVVAAPLNSLSPELMKEANEPTAINKNKAITPIITALLRL
jgi:hypothetical protein